MVLPVRTNSLKFGATARTGMAPRRLTFQLQGGAFKGPTYGGRRPDGRRYRSGEMVRQSGIYEVIHDRNHREAHEAVMISGERFPDCETCKDKVRFRLIRTAPYIFRDEDFEEEA